MFVKGFGEGTRRGVRAEDTFTERHWPLRSCSASVFTKGVRKGVRGGVRKGDGNIYMFI